MIDAIVLDLNGGGRTRDCVASLLRQTVPPRRIVVFDNGSVRPTRDTLGIDHPSIVHRRSSQNLGFCGGINAAMADVSERFVAWVNNDVVLEPRWAEVLVDRMTRDESIAAAQTWIGLSGTSTLDGAGIDLSDGTFRQSARGLDAGAGTLPRAWGVSATAALLRTSALRAVSAGGPVLHPQFFAWYEDVELNARLLEAGWKVAVVPELLAWHEGSATAPSLGERALALQVRNRYFVRRLHPDVGSLPALLFEDLKRAIKAVLKLKLRDAVRVGAAVAEGLTAPLATDSAGRFV